MEFDSQVFLFRKQVNGIFKLYFLLHAPISYEQIFVLSKPVFKLG